MPPNALGGEREPKPGISQARQNGPITPICDDLFVLRKHHVVPANARTHNHRWLLLNELLPQIAVTFHITVTEGMGPGVRRDDDGVFVGALRKFPIQISNSRDSAFSRRHAPELCQ
jgi:hypothetical protein